MANSRIRITFAFLVIFSVANGVQSYDEDDQGTVDLNDSPGLRNREEIVDNEEPNARRNLDDDTVVNRRKEVVDDGVRILPPEHKQKERRLRSQDGKDAILSRSQDRDRRDPYQRDREMVFHNQMDRRIRGRKDKRNQDWNRYDQDRDGRNQDSDRRDLYDQYYRAFERRDKPYQELRDQDSDRKDLVDYRHNPYYRGFDRKYRPNQELRDQDYDRQDSDNYRFNSYYRVKDRRERPYQELRDQDYDRKDSADYRLNSYDRVKDRRERPYQELRDQDYNRKDSADYRLNSYDRVKDRRERPYHELRHQSDDRADDDYDRRNVDSYRIYDDDGDDNDRSDRGTILPYQYQRTGNQRTDQKPIHVRDSGKNSENEDTRRFTDYTERLRYQKKQNDNQNTHMLQYIFQRDDFPKQNYNLHVHKLDWIQPDVKHMTVDPRILVWQDESWIRSNVRGEHIAREADDNYSYLSEALKITDKSTEEILKVVRNVAPGSKDTYYGLEILNVVDALAEHGVCNPSESHYNWIYFLVMPIALAEVRLRPLTVAKKIEQKIEKSHMAFAELRGVIETVTSTQCQEISVSDCDDLIAQTIRASAYKDLLNKQVTYLKKLAELSYTFLANMTEYSNVVANKNVLAYFTTAKTRTWPLVNKLITARLEYGEGVKHC